MVVTTNVCNLCCDKYPGAAGATGPNGSVKAAVAAKFVSGKEYRVALGTKNKKQRLVQPFSTQSMQKNTKTISPPSVFLFRERNVTTTLFRKYFDRGDLPISRSIRADKTAVQMLTWRIPPQKLEFAYYLPVFFEGLAENEIPYKLLARYGVSDMLSVGGDKILPVVPQLIIPIKNALNTRNNEIIIATLKAIRQLVMTGPYIGRALVPYYRQILPVFNMFRAVNQNIGDQISNPDGSVGDHIEETLQLMERCGGPDAFINIKYMVPTYESSVMN